MSVEDPNELERVDREIRLNEIKQRAGAIDARISDDCPPDVAEGFVNYIERWENAPYTTGFEQLKRTGLEPAPADEVEDARLTAALWELLERLAELRVFLYRTDHLSDRELYTLLRDDLLHEEVKDLPVDENSAYHLDILGACSEEDIHLSLKYYADEEERGRWREDFPEDEIPAHEDPPYDRDSRLPKVAYGGSRPDASSSG